MGDITGDFHGGVHGGAGEEDDDERVHEWEAGLPTLNDLIPLTQGLIPPELLSAFDIRPEPCRTAGDVSRATRDTISAIHGSNFIEVVAVADEEIEEEEEEEAEESDSKKARRNESPEEADSAAAKALKRPRLVWTPQLHKRFVDVVAHLGIKNAVPKTIMQLMNVDGLTRENVASHLQKYRLYLKRMQGVSFDGPANSSDPLFANSPAPAPAPASLPENGHGHSGMPIPMPIMPISMPVMGTGHHGHMGMSMGIGMATGNYNYHGNNQISHHHYHHNHYLHYQYNGIMNYQQHHPPHVGDK